MLNFCSKDSPSRNSIGSNQSLHYLATVQQHTSEFFGVLVIDLRLGFGCVDVDLCVCFEVDFEEVCFEISVRAFVKVGAFVSWSKCT